MVVVLQCNKLSNFWLGVPQDAVNPYVLSISIFGLIFVWSVLDTIRAFYLKYDDRAQSAIVLLVILLCAIFISRALWAKWEYFEITWGELKAEESVFFKGHQNRINQHWSSDPWHNYLQNKICKGKI